MKHLLQLTLILFSLSFTAAAQPLTQTIMGHVVDNDTQVPLTGVSVVLMDSLAQNGTITNNNGYYSLPNVPLGRQKIAFHYLGYKPQIVNEVMVTSGKEVVLNIGLTEKPVAIGEVVVKSNTRKDLPQNAMATLSARQLTVEEASRYAGGIDDPARLASAFAGVTMGTGNNGIVVRGNAPKDLLWRMEGIEISNPNHFANLILYGGGGLTALSSHVLASSDFFTGAFPAEYGNALSGVFDLRMRTGNPEKREHTFRAGIIGIDAASEGPFKKNKRSTYLFNYRYSTLGLLSPILPKEMGALNYQDLSFKTSFPTKKAGIFYLWGLGAYDHQGKEAEKDITKWEKDADREDYTANIYFGAVGLSHQLVVGTKSYIHSTLAFSGNGLQWKQQKLDSTLVLHPDEFLNNNTWKYTLSTFINHKFSARHVNRTGFTIDQRLYNMNIRNSRDGLTETQYVKTKGSTQLIQAYTESRFDVGKAFTINAGIHSQYFALNGHYTIEPRLGVKWQFRPDQSVGIAYGLHSRLEQINFYLLEQQTTNGMVQPNKNLDFTKAQHLVLSYDRQINDHLRFKAEPYFQYLFDVPVIPNSYFSLQNLYDETFFNDSLVNRGKGWNYGIDLTLERFLHKQFYYLVTASVFQSKYKGGDGVLRDARYNRNFVCNVLGGKEWNVRQNNLFSFNIRYTIMGGDRLIPVNEAATYAQQEIVYDYSRAFEKQKPIANLLSFTLKYHVNKRKYTGIWSLEITNALGYKDLQDYRFNRKTQTIEEEKDLIMVPNLSYQIQF